MCTAINETNPRHLFGRTLDLEYSYSEKVVITPRRYRLDFLHENAAREHYAIIGAAHVQDGIPLYYDGANEAGLCAAALNFPHFCRYSYGSAGGFEIASFELIPFVLSQCDSLSSAKALLQNVKITSDSFSKGLAATPLHWIFADKNGAVCAEPREDGLALYDCAVGVITNSPPFEYHLAHLYDFSYLSSLPPENTLCPNVALESYSHSRGMGAVGLPGDLSSPSRFVRAVFMKNHTDTESDAEISVSRFFHIFDTLATPRGAVKTEKSKSVFTVYSSCIDTAEKTYYFTTYSNRQIRAVKLCDEAAEKNTITVFEMQSGENIIRLN